MTSNCALCPPVLSFIDTFTLDYSLTFLSRLLINRNNPKLIFNQKIIMQINLIITFRIILNNWTLDWEDLDLSRIARKDWTLLISCKNPSPRVDWAGRRRESGGRVRLRVAGYRIKTQSLGAAGHLLIGY